MIHNKEVTQNMNKFAAENSTHSENWGVRRIWEYKMTWKEIKIKKDKMIQGLS